MAICTTCNGNGVVPVSLRLQCAACDGSGRVLAGTCPACLGEGSESVTTETICEVCGGTGHLKAVAQTDAR